MNKILLIGCGYWGKNWYNTIKKTSSIELTGGEVVDVVIVGVVDPNPSIAISEPCFNLLEEVDVEYTHAIVATQAELHLDFFNKLKELIPSHNILIEKPCGTNLEDRLKMTKAFPGYIFLSSPQYHLLIKMLMQQQLGRLFYVNFERASMGPRIRTDVDVVEDYMIHDLYLYIALFAQVGEFDIKDFNAQGYMQHNFNDPTKADTAFFTVKKGNLIASFFSSWNYPTKHRKITIVGERGSVIWEGDKLTYTKSSYRPIDGFDNHRNPGYELVDGTLEDITPQSNLDNLQLQLRAFLEQRRRIVCMENTSQLVALLKKSAYITKK